MSDATTPYELLRLIDLRCRERAAGLPAQQENQQTWSGIGFRLGELRFVIPMGEVSEILPEPRFTALPGVKPWLKGVANVRGRLLPIADLGQFLGVKIQALRKQRRILIVDHGDLFVGLAVDEVLGMQHFDIGAYREHDDSVPPGLQFFLEGIFQRDVPWLVCSPRALVAHPEFMDVAA
ncbi:protein PilI [Pseudomonas oryzihabitans]|uniref:Twitching motility protein PilI n=1 Tax=Pseudomonas oryzihabitans TaxID=47885 RepID=A0AAJ2BGG9_9PSED|nr:MULTISPECIES: chemotaxis protein CheW [Pseudomonas]APQ13261.1 chemotaxis protein CheW [Pseudomonas psychrotolerans]KTS72459.1 protein PilI [Pseudomonas psychrotolerans]KTT04258.1 protein PilI [Pseudomonas psychrotolerans]KTT11074.1 protein PilI [Pseudomonas psychrotolerans]KTT21357.1 protein PilI [Pseudomonas psychrotolerans]